MPNQNNESPSNETENYEDLNIASRVDRQQDNPTTTNGDSFRRSKSETMHTTHKQTRTKLSFTNYRKHK